MLESLRFTYDALPMRVVFGAGALAALPAEVERLGLARVLVLSTPGQEALARRAAAMLGDRAAGVHPRAMMHVPAETAAKALAGARQLRADGCVAVGGGSTIGLGKAIALELELPIVAVPTTYAGSEMTTIWGITEDRVKRTGRDRRVLPKSVVYDPELTLDLPGELSGTSGMNAIAHGVEALYAPDTNPIVSLMAGEGIRALAESLPRIVAAPRDLESRTRALYGAWLCGACLGAVAMSLHHKLCHVLGGAFGLPHAQTHAAVLPYAVAFNAPAAPAAVDRVARALGSRDAAAGLYDLAGRLGARRTLREIGLSRDDLDRAADLAVSDPYANPCPVTRDGIRRLLEEAYEGRPPSPATPDRP